jgi:hypothetical protein
MNKSEELIRGIDFKALKNQKKIFLEMIEHNEDNIDTTELEGLLNLIDAIQDHAVDVLGFNQDDVFPTEDEPVQSETEFLGDYKFKCVCGKVHEMAMYCLAQLASGNKMNHTCDCGHKTEFDPHEDYKSCEVIITAIHFENGARKFYSEKSFVNFVQAIFEENEENEDLLIKPKTFAQAKLYLKDYCCNFEIKE